MKTYVFRSTIYGPQDFIKVSEKKGIAIIGNIQANKVVACGDTPATKKFIKSKTKELKNRGFKIYDGLKDDYEVLDVINREIEEDQENDKLN